MAIEQPILTVQPKTANGIPTNGIYTNGASALDEYVPEYVSEELYWEKYYDHPDCNYEWNNGRLEVVPVADYSKYIMYLWFVDVLRDYLHVHPCARIIGLEVGFRLIMLTHTAIRKPDLGLVLNSNRIPLLDHDRSYHGVFDLVIESVSDSSQAEIDRDTVTKRHEYAAVGVQEYYILDERRLETQFYQLGQDGLYRPIERIDGIVRSGVLPGFQFRVNDLYSRPTPPQMVTDPIYRDFISPYYRMERMRAEQERMRAEQAEAQASVERMRAEQAEAQASVERNRAEQERLRADQYAAMLRAAGLLPQA